MEPRGEAQSAAGRRAQRRVGVADWEETKDEFRARLRETAFSIPASEIRKAMGSMVRRCKELANGDGNYIKGD